MGTHHARQHRIASFKPNPRLDWLTTFASAQRDRFARSLRRSEERIALAYSRCPTATVMESRGTKGHATTHSQARIDRLVG